MAVYTILLSMLFVIASALVAGVFLAFSEFVMRSLDKSNRAGGIEAMQIINREVFRTFFMVCLIGLAPLSAVMIWLAWVSPVPVVSGLLTAGGLSYIVLVFAVTILGNVPLNVQLDRLDHRTSETADYWSSVFYLNWTRLNHVRTGGAALASLFFMLAIAWPSLG